MVIRGYPSEDIPPSERIPEIVPPPGVEPEVKPDVKNYYTYYSTEKATLDPNVALTTSLIALGILTIGGIIIILATKKPKPK